MNHKKILLFTDGKRIPSTKNLDSKMFALYLNLMKIPSSSMIYLLVLLEGVLDLNISSYRGAA